MSRVGSAALVLAALLVLAGCGGGSGSAPTADSQLQDLARDPILQAVTLGLSGAPSINAPSGGDGASGAPAAASDSLIVHIPSGQDPAKVFRTALKALAARGVTWASIDCQEHQLYNAGGTKNVAVADSHGKTWNGSVTLGLELDPTATIGSIQGPYLQVSIDVDQATPSASAAATPAAGATTCP